MLQVPQQPPHRKGHQHRRSHAISGDFDLDFFKDPSSLSTTSISIDTKNDNSESKPSFASQPLTPPSFASQSSNPKFMISEPEPAMPDNCTDSQSAKKHTRLNSWAHSLVSTKKKEKKHTKFFHEGNAKTSVDSPTDIATVGEIAMEAPTETPTIESTPKLDSNFSYKSSDGPLSSPDLSNYDIPKAIIDLDLASGIIYDPASRNNFYTFNSNYTTFNYNHKRAESAPELDDFLKYKNFMNTLNKSRPRNSAIYEVEDEDDHEEKDNDDSNDEDNKGDRHNNAAIADISSGGNLGGTFEGDAGDVREVPNDDDDITSLISSNHSNMNSTSFISLHSNASLFKNTTSFFSGSTVSNPNITKNVSSSNIQSSAPSYQSSLPYNGATRRGANAKRYQNYYNNNFLLANALKSSDSLTNNLKQTMTSKSTQQISNLKLNPSINNSQASIISSSVSQPASCIFKFESQSFDISQKNSYIDPIPMKKHSSQPQMNSQLAPQARSNTDSSVNPSSPNFTSNQNALLKNTSKSRYHHKKSNSLLNSLNLKIKRNSLFFSSEKTHSRTLTGSDRRPVSTSISAEHNQGASYGSSGNDHDFFYFGEPGPELDLTTMKPKYPHKKDTPKLKSLSKKSKSKSASTPASTASSIILTSQSLKFNGCNNTMNSSIKSEKRYKGFFNWRKKEKDGK